MAVTWTGPLVLVTPVRVVETVPAAEPLTLDEAKLAAGLDWPAGDPRDPQMEGFIAAARGYVEQRTNRAIPPQRHDLFYDGVGVGVGTVLVIPGQSQPVQNVLVLAIIDPTGVETILDPSTYQVQPGRGLVSLVGPLPPDVPLRPFEGLRMALMCGAPDVAPELRQAIGLLVAHYATTGRDLTITGTIVAPTPLGFEETIAPFVPQVLP